MSNTYIFSGSSVLCSVYMWQPEGEEFFRGTSSFLFMPVFYVILYFQYIILQWRHEVLDIVIGTIRYNRYFKIKFYKLYILKDTSFEENSAFINSQHWYYVYSVTYAFPSFSL
jgi:hypothetical protein